MILDLESLDSAEEERFLIPLLRQRMLANARLAEKTIEDKIREVCKTFLGKQINPSLINFIENKINDKLFPNLVDEIYFTNLSKTEFEVKCRLYNPPNTIVITCNVAIT